MRGIKTEKVRGSNEERETDRDEGRKERETDLGVFTVCETGSLATC